MDVDFSINAKGSQVMYDAIECVDGCILAVGSTESMNGGGLNAWVVKITKEGKLALRKSFGTNEMDDRATAVAELPSGLILTGGTSVPKLDSKNGGHQKAWLRCRDAKGEKIWDREIDEHSSNIKIEDIVVDRLHNQVMVLMTKGGRLWYLVTDYTGEKKLERQINAKPINDSDIRGVSMAFINGFLYAFGSLQEGVTKWSPFIVKLDISGRVVTNPVLFGDYNVEQTGQISQLNPDKLLLACSLKDGKFNADMAVIKLDTTLFKPGHTLEVLSGPGDDKAVEVQSFAAGQYYVFGNSTLRKGNSIADFCLARLNSEGQFLKEIPQIGGNNLNDTAVRFIRAIDGTLWLCGMVTKGSDLNTQTDFWFSRFSQKNAAQEPSAPVEPLKPLLVEISPKIKGLQLSPGENGQVTVFLQNPNNVPTGTILVHSQFNTAIFGANISSEIALPEIPAGGSTTFDIPVQIETTAMAASTSIGVFLSNTRKENLGKIDVPFEIKALRVELVDYHIVGEAVKGLPCMVKAIFENKGSKNGENLSLIWTAPSGISFVGEYQQSIAMLAANTRSEIVVVFTPETNFLNDMVELKAFWAEKNGDYTATFPIKIKLSEPSDKAIIPVSGGNPGFNLVVNWKADPDKKNTSFQQNFEVKVTVQSVHAVKIDQFTIWVNGSPIPANDGEKFDEVMLTAPSKSGQSNVTDFLRRIKLSPGLNAIEVEVANEDGKARTHKPLNVEYKPNDKGTLYVVSVGVPDRTGQIKFSCQDAIDFAKIMETQKGRFYGNVEVEMLTSEDSTQAKIITSKIRSLVRENESKAFGELDAVVLFISGHGFIDEDDNGVFRIQGSDYDVDAKEQTTIVFDQIVKDLDNLSCRKFILVDACQGALGDMALLGRKGNREDFDYALALENVLKGTKRVQAMTSCSKREFSYEDETWKNGAFTHVLEKTLSDRALCQTLDVNKDQALSFGELFSYINTEVNSQVKAVKKGKVQTPALYKSRKASDEDALFYFY